MNRQWQKADVLNYDILKANAKANRNNMTEAESAFWQLVSNKALGEKVLRQFVIGNYIVDFYFRKSKVVVEIDGGYHTEMQQKEDDLVRQQWIESNGYKVVRFTNEEVLCDSDACLTKLKCLLRNE